MFMVKLLYLALLAGLLVFYVLYIDSFALIMLLCALIVPVLLKVLLLVFRFNSSGALTCDSDSCAAGESIPVTLTVRNKSPFCFPMAQATVLLHHSFGAGTQCLQLRFPVQARNLTRVTFYVHAEFCGAMELSLKKISVFDYLHLFHTNLPLRQKHTNVLVLPQCVALPIHNASDPVHSQESDVYADRPGDDPSQIFGFHEYGAGDAVSRIHWKLSSKSDRLFVKEFSLPIQKSVLILLNYSGAPRSSMQVRIQQAETFLTLFYSVIFQMLDQQMLPVIVWYDGAQKQLELHHPTAHGQLSDLFRALYDSIGAMELDVQQVMDSLASQRYSSLTCITNHLPHMLLELVDKRVTANCKTILHVCSPDEQQQTAAAEIAETVVLPVRAGRMQEDITQLVL